MYILHTFKTADIGCCTDRVECFALNNYEKFCNLFFPENLRNFMLKHVILPASNIRSKEQREETILKARFCLLGFIRLLCD